MSVEGKGEARCCFPLLCETQRPLRLFTLSLEGCVIFQSSYLTQKSRRIVMIQTGGRYRIVLVTCGSTAEARNIGRSVVEKKLAACANILAGVEAIYWGEGKMERGRGGLVGMKNTAAWFRKLERGGKRLHNYHVAAFHRVSV